ncbi:hypothetical protein HY988_01340 [Candidatus Micrarchaeota archaeon]|nr:hypothetical protein [Candidatus Micrarchaeota archaeon]
MEENDLIREYLSLHSTREISDKFNVPLEKVKSILSVALGRDKYMKIAHQIGAKKVSQKLADPSFRKKYSEKMTISVSKALKTKMQDSAFRDAWLIKANSASLKGNDRIKYLLSTDPAFYEKWLGKCTDGGKKLTQIKKGIHDPLNQTERTKWSIKGLKKTGRKLTGPKGEHMYNYLEVSVAKVLNQYSMDYEYEKLVPAPNTNGFLSLDFVLSDGTVVETTYWDDIEQKSKDLTNKFNHLKSNFGISTTFLITKKSKSAGYKRLLPPYVTVLSLQEFKHLVAGKRGKMIQ